MSQLAAPAMVRYRGQRRDRRHLLAGLGHGPSAAFRAYGAGKAALNQMTRNLAGEFAPLVRVNAIIVGGVTHDIRGSKSSSPTTSCGP